MARIQAQSAEDRFLSSQVIFRRGRWMLHRFTLLLVVCAGMQSLTAWSADSTHLGKAPQASAQQIQQALRYGDLFQQQMPSRSTRFTTPPQTIPQAYLAVPAREYCSIYPYAPYCVPVIQPYYRPHWGWGGW